MLTLVFMKIAADLALYYTFAGFFAVLFGASSNVILLILAMQAVVFTLSYALRRFGRWRFLPLVLQALCLLVPGAGLADYIVIVPPALYMIYLTAKNIYEPDRFQQIRIFSVFWKAILVFSVFCSLIGKAEQVRSIVLPAGLIMLMCSVLLMRSLRHEPQVYCQGKYQAVNVLLICAACVCALFLSSGMFLGTCLGIFKAVYDWVIGPVFIAIFYLLIIIVNGIVWLASFIKFHDPEVEHETPTIKGTSLQELLDLEGQPTSGVWVDRIAIAVGILAAVVILILVFRALAKRESPQRPERGIRETRIGLSQKKERPDDILAGSPVARVRAQYKKFLKLISLQQLEPKQSDTSLDISRKYCGMFDAPPVSELREIYIEARYDGRADRKDVQRAKQLYAEIKKSSQK